MDDRAALFANVLSAPADDAARLVLADWLEENGEEDFGRFLRAGVVAAEFRDIELIHGGEYYAAIETIAAVAASGLPARWLSDVGVGPHPLADTDWLWDNACDRVTVRIGVSAGVFERGLLSELIVPLAVWYDVASRGFSAWPIERASVTDLRGLSFWVDAPGDGRDRWRLSAGITVQARRPQPDLLRQLGEVLGLGLSRDDPPPVPPTRWSAERTFASREELAGSMASASAMLFAEVMDAAGAQWNPLP